MKSGNKAPEPTEQDIARANAASAREVFDGSDGRLTVAYYRRLQTAGAIGVVAMNLFRAQKTSTRAKVYRAKRFRHASYDVKNYSLDQLVKALQNLPTVTWGWGRDASTPGFEWVLYVELPQIDRETKQVSFHSAQRLSGPNYDGAWDGERLSRERILAFCDDVLRVDQAWKRHSENRNEVIENIGNAAVQQAD